MGCGSSRIKQSDVRKGTVDHFCQQLARQGCGRGQQEDMLTTLEHNNRQSGETFENSKPTGEMEKSERVAKDDISDHNNCNVKICVSDIICTDIEDGSEAYHVLQSTATVEILVEEGKKLISEIDAMPLHIENMPENFEIARKLRLIYHNARYNIGVDFCKLYLDKIIAEGLFSCLAKAFRRLQKRWPEMFSKVTNPKEAFRPPLYALSVSKFPRPEMAVATVWMKLNDTVLGTTDLHEGCRIKAAEEGVLEYLLMEGIPAMANEVYPGVRTVIGRLLQKAVSSVYNCSMSTANVSYFEKFDAVNILLKLGETSSERLNMTILFALAYLIDEKNNHLIVSTNETISNIIRFLSKSTGFDERRYCGLSNIEIANALTRIAVNDDNKRMIGCENGLHALLNMFSAAKSDDERISSANALWMLLFDKGNQESFKAIDNAVNMITAHKNSENVDLKKAISGIIWELETKYELQEKVGVKEEGKQCKHVMISYNWGQQPVMMKIRDELRSAGYSVWMDVDKIGGSTLEAMALAVENSAVILVAVSRKYKESANCRSEAEYAFQLRKSVVPLMMENNYQPDGWLGFVVGAKFWIDFTNKLQFKDDFKKLVKEIGDRGKIGSEIMRSIDVVDIGAPMENALQTEANTFRSWDNGKVKAWLCSKNHLDKKIRKSILDELTGKHLTSLHRLRQESPEFFFNSIREDFGFNNILALLDFTDAIQELNDSI